MLDRKRRQHIHRFRTMGESRTEYYGKWDSFAEEEAKRIESEVEREKEEAARCVFHRRQLPSQ